ncbi:MAG: MFS transporter [Novosphingobium sp.]|nr:MFS transporter [Novosphingobium sp.]
MSDTGHQGALYGKEMRQHKREMTGVAAGMGAGFLLNHYTANIFAPQLISEFGWSRAEFALIGALGLLSVLVVPIAGRMTDIFGCRRVALVGVISFPLTFVAYSQMNGSISLYAAITVIQNLLAGATTSSLVYSRVIAERFVAARGLALGIAATSPALVGMLGTPLLESVIGQHGWRAGYLSVAGWTAVVGGLALLLIPSGTQRRRSGTDERARRARVDYIMVLRAPKFWAIFFGFFLCNLIYPLQSSQMKLMLLESGASAQLSAALISAFAGGVMLGRLVCGLALDRYPPHRVACVAMGLPAIGLTLLAAGVTTPAALSIAVVFMGLSLGAESDLAAYLVMRYFKVEIYGTVLGLVVLALGLSAAFGAAVLSISLKSANHFWPYMSFAAVMTCLGSVVFLTLGRTDPQRRGE